MENRLKNLMNQLVGKGIDSVDSLPSSGMEDLPSARWRDVSGGFGQILFQQYFHQIYDPSTGFRQNIVGHPIQN